MAEVDFKLEINVFLQLAESTVAYVKHCYEEEVEKDDIVDLTEQVLQYGAIVLDERYATIDAMHPSCCCDEVREVYGEDGK